MRESDDNLFAGSQGPMEDPAWGKVWARNLTPDRATGLSKGEDYGADYECNS